MFSPKAGSFQLCLRAACIGQGVRVEHGIIRLWRLSEDSWYRGGGGTLSDRKVAVNRYRAGGGVAWLWESV